jgi:glycosyltransferase involved in cell wall biosynthesis
MSYLDVSAKTAAFIMPHFGYGDKTDMQYLQIAITSILNQTDENWMLILVDDGSPNVFVKSQLYDIAQLSPGKIHLLFCDANAGPGTARNVGIEYARKMQCPFVLFADADDLSDKRRLEVVRKTFAKQSDVNVVYSTFIAIDENGDVVPDDKICFSIREILQGHKLNPVEGENAWIQIATEKNYTNLTSSTAVKTKLAYKTKFPSYKVSEDSHTWLRYGAHKGKFIYRPEIPTMYRVKLNSGSATRARESDFYKQKAFVDTDGFIEAMKIALRNGNIHYRDVSMLSVKFHIRLAVSMMCGEQFQLAKEEINTAQNISRHMTATVLSSLTDDFKSCLIRIANSKSDSFEVL